MDIWVVSLFGSTESVWSTEQRAQIQVEALNRSEGGSAYYDKYILNAPGLEGLDDEPQKSE